jgi:hypothetical protein
MKNRRNITIAVLLSFWALLVGYKVAFLGVQPKDVIPVSAREVTLKMKFNGHGSDISIKTFVPQNSTKQEIIEFKLPNSNFSEDITNIDDNSQLEISGFDVSGEHQLSVSWQINPKVIEYKLPSEISLRDFSENRSMKPWLIATDMIQSGTEEIAKLSEMLGINESQNGREIVDAAFRFAYDSLSSAKFSSRTDALLALTLREASCNGKSRLFVAINRHFGIPSRLVGGLIMNDGSKRTTHQWAEVYLGGEWVPFDPLNGHYATLPDNYLQFYVGDEPLFVRSSNINFYYEYNIKTVMVSRRSSGVAKSSIFNTGRLWELFDKAGIPLSTLRILLMIPLGAIIIIIFRNVIGVHTYGTFLPVLIATSMRESGLLWGMIIFSSVILIGIFVRQLLEKYKLLHSPKLTIILISVIGSLITLTVIGIKTGNRELLNASMFPLAILAITTERFCTVIESSGLKKAMIIFFWSLVVVSFCYISMLSILIQSIVMVFPETLLLFVAMSIYLGSWNSLRLMEFIRFRKIIFSSEKSR